MGILGCGWGSTPVLLAPSVWLGCCWWGVVGLDSASEGTTLIFRVVLGFGGIVCEEFCFVFFFLPLFVSQLPNEVANCKVVRCASGVGLLLVALGPSFLDKGVGISPAATQVGLAYMQTRPGLLGTCLRQAELFQTSCGRHNNNNKINKIYGHSAGNDQTTLTHNYSSNNNHFYGRERAEQEWTSINIYGLIRTLGNQLKSDPQEQSQRGKNVPSQRN